MTYVVRYYVVWIRAQAYRESLYPCHTTMSYLSHEYRIIFFITKCGKFNFWCLCTWIESSTFFYVCGKKKTKQVSSIVWVSVASLYICEHLHAAGHSLVYCLSIAENIVWRHFPRGSQHVKPGAPSTRACLTNLLALMLITPSTQISRVFRYKVTCRIYSASGK